MAGSVAIGAGPAWLRRHSAAGGGANGEAQSGDPRPRRRRLRRHAPQGASPWRRRSRRGRDTLTRERQGLKVIPLTSDRLRVACRAGHPLTRMKRVTMQHLLDYPWSMPPLSTRTTRRLQALFIAADLAPPETTVETESMAFLIQTVLNSDAITLTVASTLDMPEAKGLRLLSLSGWRRGARLASCCARTDSFRRRRRPLLKSSRAFARWSRQTDSCGRTRMTRHRRRGSSTRRPPSGSGQASGYYLARAATPATESPGDPSKPSGQPRAGPAARGWVLPVGWPPANRPLFLPVFADRQPARPRAITYCNCLVFWRSLGD